MMTHCKKYTLDWHLLVSIAVIGFSLVLVFFPFNVNFVHMIIIPYLFSAVADTVDYGLKRWGKGAMAMSYSGHLLALKIGIALGGALSGWILAYVGYQPNVEQTETALSGIVFLYAWASAIAGAILFVCFRFYHLNREWAEENELLMEAA